MRVTRRTSKQRTGLRSSSNHRNIRTTGASGLHAGDSNSTMAVNLDDGHSRKQIPDLRNKPGGRTIRPASLQSLRDSDRLRRCPGKTYPGGRKSLAGKRARRDANRSMMARHLPHLPGQATFSQLRTSLSALPLCLPLWSALIESSKVQR